jgi:uncharacterized protein (TIGR02145 family)
LAKSPFTNNFTKKYSLQMAEIKTDNQIWMQRNLNVSRFRNGDLILEAKTDEEWQLAGANREAAYCYYDNNSENGLKYGKLYNWFAVNDPRGLAPEGWHIPNQEEWDLLINFLGGNDYAQVNMKSLSNWCSKEFETRESTFQGLPGGFRDKDGCFSSLGYIGNWWCFTEFHPSASWNYDHHALIINLECKDNYHFRTFRNKQDGVSVRCLKNISTQNVEEIKIRGQIWMRHNLVLDRFCNGDIIGEAKTSQEWKQAFEKCEPIWCYYNFNPSNGAKYGKIYNWFAVSDPRKLAPNNWQIPSIENWQDLIKNLGSGAGDKIKSRREWYNRGGGEDSIGFTALAGGYCNEDGECVGRITATSWWSTSEYNKQKAWRFYLSYYRNKDIVIDHSYKSYGFYIRCIKEQ